MQARQNSGLDNNDIKEIKVFLRTYNDAIDCAKSIAEHDAQVGHFKSNIRYLIKALKNDQMLIDKSSQVVVADDGRPVQSYNLLKFSQSLFQKFKLEEVDNSREFEKKIDNAIIQLEKDIQEKKANIRKLMKEVTFNDDLIPSSKNRHSALVI